MMRLQDNLKAYFSALALLIIVVPAILLAALTSAATPQLTRRYVQIDASLANAVTNHTFGFDSNTVSVLGSIKFEYCDNSPLDNVPCNAPAGFSAAGATLANQSGATGFNIAASGSPNVILISRVPAGNLPGSDSYKFASVHNQSAPAQTVFVRISTYPTVDGTGAQNEYGSVAYSTAVGIGVGAYVPPYLTFCAAVTVANDCTSSNGQFLNFGELSSTVVRSVTSQFAGATNDVNGYQVSVQGTTMTSGNNVIIGMPVPLASNPGTPQFGFNLRANNAPQVGQDPVGGGTAVPLADFNQPNRFVFETGQIAASPLSTDFNTMTVSYIVNIPKGQAPGVYSTTMTYIATAAF